MNMSESTVPPSIAVKSNVKAGGLKFNRAETLAAVAVKSNVKVGGPGLVLQRCETLASGG